MKKSIQIVENSDRYHVSVNSSPIRTFMNDDYKSKEICYMSACFTAWHTAIEEQENGYELELKPTEKK